MKLSTFLLVGTGLLASTAVAYSASGNSRRNFLSTSAASAASVVTAFNPLAARAEDDDLYKDFITTESGLKYKVVKEGTGAIPQAGQTVKTHYTGWLDGFDSPKKFDSSRDRNRPFPFKVGAGQGMYMIVVLLFVSL